MRNIFILSFIALFSVACTKNTEVNEIDIPQANVDTSMESFAEGTQGLSQTQSEMDEQIDNARENFIAKHPDTKNSIEFVNKIQIKSGVEFYEYVTTQGVLYSNYDADFVLIGNILVGAGEEVVNISEREDLIHMLNEIASSQPQVGISPAQEPRGAFDGLPLNAGLEFIYGDGANHIVVFEDPDCQFCQNLHAQLDAWGSEVGLRATVLPYSLARHPNSMERTKALYCSENREQAWKKWMTDAKDESNMDEYWAKWSVENNMLNTDCPQVVVVEAMQMIGKDMGITSTPTILFENGQTIDGLPDKELFIATMKL